MLQYTITPQNVIFSEKEGNFACYGLLTQSTRRFHCSSRGCITKWTGHVMRMEDSRLPNQTFCSELARDTRNRYKDSLKNSLRACDIPVKGWEHLAADSSAWRLATHNGAQAFEEKRLLQLLGDSGGVVNSLGFCPVSLKSLGCFYFRCVLSSQWKGGDSEFGNFTLPTLKAFLEARSHNLSGNKQ